MEYTSMGARGKYSSENNLWSRPWSASQPSSRRGSEQSVKDGSNVPRTGVISEDNNNNTDVTKIGASIESLRRDGELSMGAPPPLTAAFSGSVSNFTHQNVPNVNLVHRRGSRRSVAEGPPGLSVDRTADINGDEGQAVRSSGNLSQGSTLGSALGSRSLHKQKSGEVHVSVPPGLSSINDVSSSAEELASNTNVAIKGSTNKMNQNSGNESSLPPKFSLKQSKNDVNRSTPQGFSSQQDMTASIDDTPANSNSNLQTPQQQGGGVGGKTKSPYASRSSLQKSTEAVRSRNELKPPPGLSYPQNSASTNGSLQTPPQHEEKKTKSPYTSRASFKTSTDMDVSNQQSRNELRPPPGLSSTQGSSAKIDENQNKSGSVTENVQKGGSGKSKSARGSKASVHKGSASQVNSDEQRREYTAAHNDSLGYDPSQPSKKDAGDEKKSLGVSKSMNLGPMDSVASVAPSPSKSAFDLRSQDPVDKKGASNSLLSKHERRVRIEDPPVTSFSEHEGSATLGPKKEVARASSSGLANKSVGELAANDSSAYSWLTDRVREPQKEVKTYSPKEVRTSFVSLEPRKIDADLGTKEKEKETHEKASGASYNLLAGNSTTKSYSPKEVQTSFASLAPLPPRTDLGTKEKETHEKASGASYNLLSGTKSFSPKEVQTSFASVKDHRIKETQEKANGTSYNQLAGNDREPQATNSSKFQSSGDLNAKPEPVKPNESVSSYSAAPSAFVASVLASIRAQNKAAEFQNAAKSTEPLAFDKVHDKPTTTASNHSLGSRNVASEFGSRTTVPQNDMHRFSSNNPSTTTSASKLNDRFGVDEHVKNSRTNNTLASENSLYSGPSLNTSQRSIVDRRTDRDDSDSHRLGKTVSIGGINSVGNSASNLVGGSRGSVRVDNSQVSIGNSANNLVGGSRNSVGSEFSLSASERGSTNSLRKRYGSEESKTETRKEEDTVKSVEPAFERSYAFALKWDPYTLRVKCEHKGEIRLAYLPIRKILDEPDDSCMIIDTFQKLFSDSIHNPDIFDPSRHFLAFLDADGDWCTLGDTPEDYKVFVESSKFDPTKAASRVARLKSFDLSILEDLSRRESTDSVEEEKVNEYEDDSTRIKTSRRPSQGSIKSTTSIGERSGGRKLMHGNSEDLQEIQQRKDSFASSVLSIFSSTGFVFPDEAFSIQQAVSLGWLCGAAPMAVAVRHSEFWKTSGFQTEEYHREEYWYDYTIFALGVSMLLSFIGFARAVTVDKQRLGLALLCVNAISFCSYLSIVAGLTPSVSDIVNRPLEIVRYMDWAFTCPMLILLMGQLTQTERKIGRAMIVNVVMITTRFFGSCLPWSYGLPFSASSFACFSFLISDMWCRWSAAVAREKANVNDQRGSIGVETLFILQILTTASSIMYPIIWLLGISDVVSFEEGEILYCVADVLAKVVFTMIAVSNCFEKSQPLRLELNSDITVAKNLTEKKPNASTTSLNSVGRTLQREEPSVEMDTFEAATVVSCDIIGYTAMVDRFTPNSSSKTLHNLWKHFESIARVYRIYKVESKGGTFMGVAGAPDPSNNHAEQAAEFALDVLQMVKVFTTEQNKNGQQEKIRIRIGLHTGPLSAGIVDRKSFRYGIFGDTVTMAGQLEATCDPMRIHVSEEVYKGLEGKGFEFEECDDVEGNGKGITYFLVGKRMD